jgi:predicted nucleic acid-binding protein
METLMARRLSAGAVVDASVAVKWVLPEEHSEAALRLLESGIGLTAPAHWLVEALNAVRAVCQGGGIDRHEVRELTLALVEAPIATVPLEQLTGSAMDIALRLHITIYDALYLALAQREGETLITDDRRLLQSAQSDQQLRARVRWIGAT